MKLRLLLAASWTITIAVVVGVVMALAAPRQDGPVAQPAPITTVTPSASPTMCALVPNRYPGGAPASGSHVECAEIP